MKRVARKPSAHTHMYTNGLNTSADVTAAYESVIYFSCTKRIRNFCKTNGFCMPRDLIHNFCMTKEFRTTSDFLKTQCPPQLL